MYRYTHTHTYTHPTHMQTTHMYTHIYILHTHLKWKKIDSEWEEMHMCCVYCDQPSIHRPVCVTFISVESS